MYRLFPFLLLLLSAPVIADSDDFAPLRVGITPAMESVAVRHRGEWVWIERAQNADNRTHPEYAQTSRDCPPFCIQPMVLAEGVETLGELEFIDYLVRQGRDESVRVVDARSDAEYRSGAIPGAASVPWTDLVAEVGAVDFLIEERLTDFGVALDGTDADFTAARTLVVYDNGPWCGQAAGKIRALLSMGYPPERIKWYRGGLQAWHSLGLTVIMP
jgi:rhodanese-related sulfurtransferase